MTTPTVWSNRRRIRRRCYMALLAIDAGALAAGFSFANLLRFGDIADPQGLGLFAITFALYLMCAGRAYHADILCEWIRAIPSALMGLTISALIIVLTAFCLHSSTDISRIVFVAGIVTSTILLVLGRAALGHTARALLGGSAITEVLFVDGDEGGVRYPETVRRLDGGPIGRKLAGNNPEALDELARTLDGVDRVVVTCPPERRGTWAMMLKGCNIRAEIVIPELDRIGVLGSSHFHGISTMLISTGPLRTRDQIVKRGLDLAIVIPMILLFLPLLTLIPLLIRLDSPGPVLFVQKRIGLNNRLFSVYKFRSMYTDRCDANGNTSAGRTDNRITRVGRFIRATSVDELPQLLNILGGSMSFVGPRPHALGSLAGQQLFWEVDARYWHRHVCKPGLTGLAQVRGFRGATHRREDLINRLQADLEYVNGWSIWRDLWILLTTVRVVVHPNAY
ncbi:exopolysaccharide biosynthesis polyprenyl glycosylphosphotransferase [Sphingomonas sp.]|uniref:exopolysaccharide biosynthesis polyprenyl glycosylphosphotransferase n=1 Tax=Sphingomonas sp. TaxID=28214 RepID=UPI0031E2479D